MSPIFDPAIDSVEDVLAIRDTALAQLSSGNVSWSSEGTSYSRIPSISNTVLLQECRRFLKAARPDLYGRRVTQVTIYPGN